METPEAAQARRRRPGAPFPRSRRRQWRRALGLCLYVVILVEIVSLLAFWVRDRTFFSFARIREEQAEVLGTPAPDGAATVPNQRDHVIHPYVGWVRDFDTPSGNDPILFPAKLTRFGFRDQPVRKRDDRTLIVAVLGGSVAVMLGEAAGDVLVSGLARAPAYAGKEVVLVRLAVAAGKQPQQAMMLNYLLSIGAEFDIVVNIDGFNEIALPPDNLSAGMYPWFPLGWWAAASRLGTPVEMRRIVQAVQLSDARRTWAAFFHDSWLRFSVAASFVWSTRDRILAASMSTAGVKDPAEALPFQARGPGTEGFSEANILGESAELWERCSRLLHDTCRSRGILYHHFLQPNQYFAGSKVLSEDERRTAFSADHPWKPRVEAAYPGLVARGRSLDAAGVAFTDLTMVFHGIERSIYIDNCCHVSAEGSAILARRIVDEILIRSGQARSDLTGIRAARSPIVLDPKEPMSLHILATYADGSESDVTPGSKGTVYVSSHPAFLSASADGALRPFRTGTATIEATHQGRRLRIPVEVRSNEAVSSIPCGIAGSGGFVPRIAAAGAPAIGTKEFLLSLSGVRGAAQGELLLQRGGPPQWHAGATGLRFAEDCVHIPVTAEGEPDVPGEGSLVHRLPFPVDVAFKGEILYLQAIFGDSAAAGGWSASDVLVVVAQ